MNFSELFEQAQLVDPTDSIHLTVGVWRYYFPEHPNLPTSKLEWMIFSSKMNRSFAASAAEDVLTHYQNAYRMANEVRNLAVDLAAVDV